jgi:purine-cytosine permease-like protein
MTEGAVTTEPEQPPFGDVLLEALKGIRSEILLYGIVVIIIIVGSAQFGIAVLQTLEIPLLIFATFVLIIYFILALMSARKRVIKQKAEQGRTP